MTRIVAALLGLCAAIHAQQVLPIAPPPTPFKAESATSKVKKFSFLAYGDTRGNQDGTAIQADHSRVADAMIAQAPRLKTAGFPLAFILQSGDGVLDGSKPDQWNVSFTPIIERLTKSLNVPYFLIPGNHDVGNANATTSPAWQAGMRNYLDAMSLLIPKEGTPRRMPGSSAYAIGYGNTFVLGLDTNIIGNQAQFDWAKAQLEGLNRKRYQHVIVFCHHTVFSSGPHGGQTVEPTTLELRNVYMPLFRANHVTAVISGHEHFFEHWVERYSDATGPHRMDLVVSGGGGAPAYNFRQLPDTLPYTQANAASQVRLEQIAQPGPAGTNPLHFLIVKVDGSKLQIEAIAADPTVNFSPFRVNTVDLQK